MNTFSKETKLLVKTFVSSNLPLPLLGHLWLGKQQYTDDGLIY